MSENAKVRVRFAPSPTGPLHIGGVRTALYNYLFARKWGGDFVLRIEDTDQNRYVEGAESYIIESLAWLGLQFDEGPMTGGAFGPYRQSERKDIYLKYAEHLVASGHAYYAFDSPEDIEEMKARYKEMGIHTPKYDWLTRSSMKNSLHLTEEEFNIELAKAENTVIRLKVEKDQMVRFTDLVRGQVEFNTNELDDKVLIKADGMPTYHLANIIDDHLMNISHVIRGEEWLSSTAHHVLLYRAMGWEDTMPAFAHLPLILKPSGNGKLSKRDGAKFGFPVFPMEWNDHHSGETFHGFREDGFNAKAVLNFLALLGWNPGNDQEIFSMEELVNAFSLEKIVKSGARFDIEKAKWFNQQYIIGMDAMALLTEVRPFLPAGLSDEYYIKFISLFKERVSLYPEFYEKGYYFFTEINEYEEKMIRKKFREENMGYYEQLTNTIQSLEIFIADHIQETIKCFIEDNDLKFGDFFPILRLAISGTMSGPDLFEMIELMGKETVIKRLKHAWSIFPGLSQKEI